MFFISSAVFLIISPTVNDIHIIYLRNFWHEKCSCRPVNFGMGQEKNRSIYLLNCERWVWCHLFDTALLTRIYQRFSLYSKKLDGIMNLIMLMVYWCYTDRGGAMGLDFTSNGISYLKDDKTSGEKRGPSLAESYCQGR